MNKIEFINELRTKLKGLPKDDVDERMNFYSEMIDDLIEDGKSEEEAINELGGVDKVISEISKETPLKKLIKEKTRPKHELKAWQIILIILGFPLWFPLITIMCVLVLVLYVLIWVFVIVIYALDLVFTITSFAALLAFIIVLFVPYFNYGYLGIGIFSIGLSILFFFASVAITKLAIKLSKNILIGIKKIFITRS